MDCSLPHRCCPLAMITSYRMHLTRVLIFPLVSFFFVLPAKWLAAHPKGTLFVISVAENSCLPEKHATEAVRILRSTCFQPY